MSDERQNANEVEPIPQVEAVRRPVDADVRRITPRGMVVAFGKHLPSVAPYDANDYEHDPMAWRIR